MPNSVITWNGQSSDDLGLVIERSPEIVKSSKKFEKFSVPGRNGDLYFYDGSFENHTQPYQVYAGRREDDAAQTSWTDIFNWLNPEPEDPTLEDFKNLTLYGYKWLIDSNEPDAIRLAVFAEGLNAENSWNRFGRTTINFDCRPERFTQDAFSSVTISRTGSTIQNPTDRLSRPMIRVNGSSYGTLTINGYVIRMNSINSYLYLDCASQNAFRLLAENMNSSVSLTTGFPVLSPGSNTISWTGGVTSVEIIPRWWRL